MCVEEPLQLICWPLNVFTSWLPTVSFNPCAPLVSCFTKGVPLVCVWNSRGGGSPTHCCPRGPETVETSLAFTTVMYQSNRSFNVPPPGNPRAFEFLANFCSNSPSRGRKVVQMPHHRSIPGDQMPPPPGNFSVTFILLRKLCM